MKLRYSIIAIALLIVVGSILYFFFISPTNNNAAFANTFEDKLRWQIETQWYWATISRILDVSVTTLAWFSSLVLLALSGYQVKNKNEYQSQISILIIIFSALAISFPALLNTFDFGRQQTIYETAAREYDDLYNQFVYSKSLTTAEAVKKYNEIHRRVQYSLINKEGLVADSLQSDL